MVAILKTDVIEKSDGSPVDLTRQRAAKVLANITTSSSTTINDSFNVSSIVDGGSGQTTYNFTNVMASSTYFMGMTAGNNGIIANAPQTSYPATASSIRGITGTSASNAVDTPITSLCIHGDLA